MSRLVDPNHTKLWLISCSIDAHTFLAVTCHPPISSSKLNYTILDGKFSYEGRLRFRCSSGFYLNGSEYAQCQANGNWSASLPSCIRK